MIDNEIILIEKENDILEVVLFTGETRKMTLGHPVTIKADNTLGWKITSAEFLKVGDKILNPKGTI